MPSIAPAFLCKSAILDKPVDLERESGLELLAFGAGKAEVREDVAATQFDPDFLVVLHLSCTSHRGSAPWRKRIPRRTALHEGQLYICLIQACVIGLGVKGDRPWKSVS